MPVPTHMRKHRPSTFRTLCGILWPSLVTGAALAVGVGLALAGLGPNTTTTVVGSATAAFPALIVANARLTELRRIRAVVERLRYSTPLHPQLDKLFWVMREWGGRRRVLAKALATYPDSALPEQASLQAYKAKKLKPAKVFGPAWLRAIFTPAAVY